MDPLDNPIDPTTSWVAAHIRQYTESGGTEGHEWRGVPTLLLTTIGARTGQGRRTPLIYGRDGDAYVIVASKGGRDTAPNWYGNLTREPRVRVQVGPDVFDADAHTAGKEDKQRLWPMMCQIWPDYANYQQRTEREIPVVVLRPRESSSRESNQA